MWKFIINFRILLAIVMSFSAQSVVAAGCVANPPVEPDSTFPSLNGKLLYHSYINYADGSGQLFMLDFSNKKLIQLSNPSWNIKDPINAMFRLDGKFITFMGIQNGAWNLFMYRIGSSSAPVNLTNSTGSTKNEDPKFSANGSQIFFKQTSWPLGVATFAIMSASVIWTNGVPSLGPVQTLVGPSSTVEYSMPFASPDSSILYYSTGSGRDAAVWSKPINPSGTATKIDGNLGNPAFYPIVRNDGTVLYTKWISNQSNQVLLRAAGANTSTIAPFNDCISSTADAAPVNGSHYTFFSSTTAGGYQLYLGDAASGKRWSLSSFGVNADPSKGKFGANYR